MPPLHVTTEGKGAGSSGGRTVKAAGGAVAGSTAASHEAGVKADADDAEDWRGAMPPKIEEGEEPPHPNVLPT
jgi:hypothetical protein